uniref:Uncharacterized protein n=1 Tax=Rhizophora mucronata TaxID=61149 RepID=A0A2P2QFC2_RHIMU
MHDKMNSMKTITKVNNWLAPSTAAAADRNEKKSCRVLLRKQMHIYIHIYIETFCTP